MRPRNIQPGHLRKQKTTPQQQTSKSPVNKIKERAMSIQN